LLPLIEFNEEHPACKIVLIPQSDSFRLKELTWNNLKKASKTNNTRMWANAQRDGRPAEHRWRPLFNAAKFG